MARNKKEEIETFSLDTEELTNIPMEKVEVEVKENLNNSKTIYKENKSEEGSLINCLRKERIIVRPILKAKGLITNPKHILFGGMAENAVRTFVVPKLTSGSFVNVLTKNEKNYLEHILGLEYNALSIHKKLDNFWDDSNDVGVSRVRLLKQDNYLDLSDPEDYIRYKILLANKEYIAPSLKSLQDFPKATYQFVIIAEEEETKSAKDSMSTTMKCYKEFGKIEDNKDILKTIIEIIDGRPIASNSKLEFLQTKINSLIQSDSKMFLKVITDPLLDTKVIIKKAVEAGVISRRGNYYYLREDGSPLCKHNEDPTFNVAATYLSLPKNQDLKFSIEAKLKQNDNI